MREFFVDGGLEVRNGFAGPIKHWSVKITNWNDQILEQQIYKI